MSEVKRVTSNIETHEFTPDANPSAERFIHDLIVKAVQKITEVSSPLAIYLQGSFGRGEGTVRFDNKGDPQLWRDLDLVAIYRLRESSTTLSRVKQELNQSPGVNPSKTPVGGSYVSIAQLPRPVVLRWRDLKMYEFAKNSLHLYGKDIRPEMAVRDGRIPLESGERFLLQKCMGLCKSLPYIESDPLLSNYEVSKTYIEISSALALKAGTPSTNFEDRLEVLRSSNNPAMTELVQRIDRWGSYKIRGKFEELEQLPARKSWLQARDDLLQALAILHDLPNNQLPYNSDEWLRKYYTNLSKRFLSTTFTSSVSSDWPPSLLPRLFGSVGSYAYRAYGTVQISEERINRLSCPLSAVYVASIIGLASIGSEEHETAIMNRMRPFLKVAGTDIQSPEPEKWVVDLDKAYQQAANPLYGMG